MGEGGSGSPWLYALKCGEDAESETCGEKAVSSCCLRLSRFAMTSASERSTAHEYPDDPNAVMVPPSLLARDSHLLGIRSYPDCDGGLVGSGRGEACGEVAR